MRNMNSLHPTVALTYFVSVFAFTMFLQNPIFAFISLLGGVAFFVCNENVKLMKEFGALIFVFVMIAVTNPLFSHNGVTVLFFLNNNPVTLEALFYGVYLGFMVLAVLIWFRCFNRIITDDKWLYLTAKISPKISLLLSSALRFIPLFKEQAAKIKNAQKALGLYSSDSWWDKLKSTLSVYSALITWGLENAIDTGASMKARGYGLKGRTNYSLYRFKNPDALILCFVTTLDLLFLILIKKAKLSFNFYPAIEISNFGIYQILAIICFAVISFLPFILNVWEGVKWKYLKSKI